MIELKIGSIDILFSTDCNMNCKYCYIRKNKQDMVEYNKKIKQAIIDGKFKENLLKTLSPKELNNIGKISLWGAEPTINANEFEILLAQLFEIMPNLDNMMFSTNSYLGYKTVNKFIEALEKVGKEYKKEYFTMNIQFSLDGPEWINDSSRKKGATQHTLDTIYAIYNNLAEDYPYNIKTTFKPTLDIDYMRKMVKDTSLIDEYLKFFDNIYNTCKDKGNNQFLKNNPPKGVPTIVVPGDYTSEDGKLFTKWIKAYQQHPLSQFYQFGQPYRYAIDTFTNSIKDYYPRADFTCNSGRYSFAFTCDGELISCHQLSKETYAKNRNSNNIVKAYSTLSGTEQFIYEYNQALVHNTTEVYYQNFLPMCIALAAANQIDKKYLKDINAQKLLFVFSQSIFCYMSQSEETQDPYFFSPSLIRFFGNGAVDALMEYAYDLSRRK